MWVLRHDHNKNIGGGQIFSYQVIDGISLASLGSFPHFVSLFELETALYKHSFV